MTEKQATAFPGGLEQHRAAHGLGAVALPLTIIEPSRGWRAVNWREIWKYRELLYFLTWRDVKVRYKQTLLGALWAILQPFMSMVVFTIFFGRLAGLENKTGGVPYPLFVYAGLLPWTLFSQSLGRCSESVVGSSNLVTKVYFPRLIIPLASTGSCLVDFACAFLVLAGMMAWYGVGGGLYVLWLPVFVLLSVMAAVGIGSFVAAVNVAYRDFRYIVPFMVQIWMFVTPVIYPVSIVPEKWRWLLALNPMTGVIEGCRTSILGVPYCLSDGVLSISIALAAFAAGVTYFRKVERRFADVV